MNLTNFIQISFAMKQHHHWSLFEMEAMTPWERDIYINMLQAYLKEEKEQMQQAQRDV